MLRDPFLGLIYFSGKSTLHSHILPEWFVIVLSIILKKKKKKCI